MLGAILGDIIGSLYEFANGHKTTEFPLFSKESCFTDDTVMTIAVSEGIINGYGDPEKTESEITASMKKWGKQYPHAGYGGMFAYWLAGDISYPYNSFGNGSAMRVSSVAWLYNTLEDVEKYAEISAKVTHNHPEGIKGAQATAAAIFMARKKADKPEIMKYISEKYGYDLSRSCDDIRPTYHFDVTCQGSVPEAIIAFIEGNSYEEVVRLAVSLGGDSDTQGAIAGSIAEAYYGIPEEIRSKGLEYLEKPMIEALNRFEEFCKGRR